MAAGIIGNFLVQSPSPGYFPMIFHQSPCTEDVEEQEMKETTKETEDEEEREVEDEDDVASEAQEEEEESLEEVFLQPAHYTVDVTRQLLTFADLISRDVQRYFGRCHSDQEACDIYNDSVSVRTSGRLRYYDDLLRIARADDQKNTGVTCGDAEVAGAAKGNSDLGPLAELFGPSQGRSQPMMKRHLPLSFWTEPISCCSLENFSNTADVTQTTSDTPSQNSMHTDTLAHYDSLQQSSMHALDTTQPDFSDLLANWDPNPELGHTLMESMHMQHGTS